jgi:hypothetical protein
VIQIALEGLSHGYWHCVSCGLTQAAKGACPTCKATLIPIEQTLLFAVEVDWQAGTIRFDVLQDQRVRLSEIKAALARFKLSIPPEQQFVPHSATLMVSGPASKEDVARLVVELKGCKLFETVAGTFDEAEHQAALEIRCVAKPRRVEVEQALAKAGESYKLADIVWVAGAHASSGRN